MPIELRNTTRAPSCLRAFVVKILHPPAGPPKTSSADPSQNQTCSADDRSGSCNARSSRPCSSAGFPSSCTTAAPPSTGRPDYPPPGTPPPVDGGAAVVHEDG